MADALRDEGRDVHVFSYKPNDGSVGIDRLAGMLAAFIRERVGTDGPLDLVGYSMGGLVCRYYVQRLGGADRVRNLVTLASPHRGTWTAYLIPNAACRQMRPGSAFLTALNADTAWSSRVTWTSIWSPLDLMIVPANRSRIDPATCHRVWVLLHPWVVSSRRVIRLVCNALATAEIASPVPAGEDGLRPGGG